MGRLPYMFSIVPKQLAEEIRELLIRNGTSTGGDLGPEQVVIELTLAPRRIRHWALLATKGPLRQACRGSPR